MDVRDIIKKGAHPTKTKGLPALCYTSKYTFEETVEAAINGSKILVCSGPENEFFRSFLKAGTGRLERVRQINFDFFSRFKEEYGPVNADLEFAVHCTGLHIIKLGVNRDELTYNVMYDEGTMALTPCAKDAEELFKKYRLERLLDCGELTTSSSSTLDSSMKPRRRRRKAWMSCW
jgi:hypothetical protein